MPTSTVPGVWNTLSRSAVACSSTLSRPIMSRVGESAAPSRSAGERAIRPSADTVAAEGTEGKQALAYVAWHTLVHAVLAGFPLILQEANDLRGGVYEGSTGWEAVFSDIHAGGNGTSACLYQTHEQVLHV